MLSGDFRNSLGITCEDSVEKNTIGPLIERLHLLYHGVINVGIVWPSLLLMINIIYCYVYFILVVFKLLVRMFHTLYKHFPSICKVQ